MNVREALRSGEHGVRCELPEGVVVEEAKNALIIGTPETLGVGVIVRRLPWRLDLSVATRDERHADVEAAARLAFEAAFKPTIHPMTGEPVSPRTNDASWSPVIEIDDEALAGRALWVLRRSNYAPMDEVHVGSWLIPTLEGVISIEVIARESDSTNYRECILLLQNEAEHPKTKGTFPPQAFYDDAAHDAAFPGHPLSRVRAARRWLEDPTKGGLAVIFPRTAIVEGEQELAEAKCAVCVPPRYVRLPQGTMSMGPTLVVFTRLCLDGASDPGLLSVCRHENAPVRPTAAELRQMAIDRVKGWKNEGVKNIEIDVRALDGDHGPEVELLIQFDTGKPCQEVQRWFTTADGAVFHVGCSQAAGWDTKRLREDVRTTRRSLRSLAMPTLQTRLPESALAAKKPWWRFGF